MASTTQPSDIETAFSSIRRPRPVLSRERERQLTKRQRTLLDDLATIFEGGFSEFTMAAIASRMSCSLRTLYVLAPSRDELVLVVVDRNLWRVGRAAQRAIQPGMSPLEGLRAYLQAAYVAVGAWTPQFVSDLATIPAAQRLKEEHNRYLCAVTERLLDQAVRMGTIGPVDTSSVACVMGRLGGDFARPEVITSLRSSPEEAADAVLDVLLCGLVNWGLFKRLGPAE
jgi:AcrR family transcriptional regulator